ncbi:MAG: hypothetical protein LLF96_01790 [Eubacteriales bacterium]|nr:hypothetical protein [Eubacteriales bacterium]
MKKILSILLLTLLGLVLFCGTAYAETAINTTEIVTQVMVWVLCGVLTAVGALATWAVKTYIIPWLKEVAVPWLKQHNLLSAAQVAVEYAEATLGRYNGQEKLKLALAYLQSVGWDIDSEQVQVAVQAKWQELDLQQLIAGVKDALQPEKKD